MHKQYIWSLFTGILTTLTFCSASGQQRDYAALQPLVRTVVDKVYPAVVSLSLYDSSAGLPLGGMFSGVVISAEGTILTAAHAAKPNRVYKVIFPDGKETVAIGLGRIASVDAALVQITTAGNWPFAEMGFSSGLETLEPCISMGYPGGLVQRAKPVVRFGYIGDPLTPGGFIRSTCLMEPGDSGGPLFDLDGYVIGIHSRIEKALESNFEIPVDAFRRYWHALLMPESYDGKKLPPQEIVPPAIFSASSAVSSGLSAALSKLESRLEKNVLSISSTINGMPVTILGTLVSVKGLLPEDSVKGFSFLISKSSMVGDTLLIKGMGSATIIKRDEANDLVLLRATVKNKNAIDLALPVDTMRYYRPGQFLLSPRAGNKGEASVLGSSPLSLVRRSNGAFLGVSSEVKEGAIVLTMISRRSAASEAMLEVGDKVVSINGMPVKEADDIAKIISMRRPNDTILFTGIRQDSLFERSIVLKTRPGMQSNHIAEFFEGGKSIRRDGFATVLVHDAKITPSECGGPLFDTEGNFLGINIARISRTSTLAIPSVIVRDFLSTVFLKQPILL